ncbi:MAG: DUF1697 domain-containing protein [Niabella sp.]
MTTYISILRGINVSGHNMIKMDALKRLCAGLGFRNIVTYIQSGNIIFQSKESDTLKLSATIRSAIDKTFSFDVPVITFTTDEIKNVISLNPFISDGTKDISFYHVTFLSDNPLKENIEKLTSIDTKNDRYEIGDKVVYLYCPDGYGRSKLTNSFWESKLKLTATTRNWKTLNALLDIAGTIQ